MSRNPPMSDLQTRGFPRVSGDEPNFEFPDISHALFSPRERG